MRHPRIFSETTQDFFEPSFVTAIVPYGQIFFINGVITCLKTKRFESMNNFQGPPRIDF